MRNRFILLVLSVFMIIVAGCGTPKCTLSITVIPQNAGSVTLSAGPVCPKDTVVTLTPVPNEGWVFDRWEGANADDLNGSAGQWTIVMDGDKALTAVFIGETSGNGSPNAVDDSVEADEDAYAVIDVLANDSDPDGDGLAVQTFNQGSHGAVTSEGFSLRYTPSADYNGPDSFSYTVSDGQGGTDVATVNISVSPLNDAPAANDDGAEVTEDGTVLITVLANDVDVDGDTLTIDSYTQGTHGGVSQEGSSLRYVPADGYVGSDSFTYTIGDGNGGTDTATVCVSVGSVNDAPAAGDDACEVNEDSTVLISVLANDDDVEGDVLTVISFVQGNHGTVAKEGNSLRYAPAANFNGADSFTYEVSDGNGGTDTGTVNVTVLAVNDSPVAGSDSTGVDEDDAAVIAVLANDTDVDGDALAISSFTQGTRGAVSKDGNSLRYVPAAQYHGSDSFTYVVSDGKGATATATVNITVASVNDAPVAVADSAKVDQDVSGLIDVLANDWDIEGDALVPTSCTQGEHGTVSVEGDSVRYTPNPGYAGGDSFTYTVSDGHGGTAVATVTVWVNLKTNIEETDGSTGRIPFVVTQAGTYQIQTSPYLVDCDTCIMLFDDPVAIYIDWNDDIDLDNGNLYSRLIKDLAPGTYYVMVQAFSGTDLFCHLEVTQL